MQFEKHELSLLLKCKLIVADPHLQKTGGAVIQTLR